MAYFYISSPSGALNRMLMEDPELLDMGTNMTAPVLRLLHYLDPGIDAPESRKKFTNVPYKTNVYTYLGVVYKDFGFVGIACIPLAVGMIISSLWGRLSHEKNIIFLPLTCHLAYVVSMTVFDDLFFRTTLLLKYGLAVVFLSLAGVKGLIRPAAGPDRSRTG